MENDHWREVFEDLYRYQPGIRLIMVGSDRLPTTIETRAKVSADLKATQPLLVIFVGKARREIQFWSHFRAELDPRTHFWLVSDGSVREEHNQWGQQLDLIITLDYLCCLPFIVVRHWNLLRMSLVSGPAYCQTR